MFLSYFTKKNLFEDWRRRERGKKKKKLFVAAYSRGRKRRGTQKFNLNPPSKKVNPEKSKKKNK